jgi:hypothetical protein
MLPQSLERCSGPDLTGNGAVHPPRSPDDELIGSAHQPPRSPIQSPIVFAPAPSQEERAALALHYHRGSLRSLQRRRRRHPRRAAPLRAGASPNRTKLVAVFSTRGSAPRQRRLLVLGVFRSLAACSCWMVHSAGSARRMEDGDGTERSLDGFGSVRPRAFGWDGIGEGGFPSELGECRTLLHP